LELFGATGAILQFAMPRYVGAGGALILKHTQRDSLDIFPTFKISFALRRYT
jgi:hypothetical protein